MEFIIIEAKPFFKLSLHRLLLLRQISLNLFNLGLQFIGIFIIKLIHLLLFTYPLKELIFFLLQLLFMIVRVHYVLDIMGPLEVFNLPLQLDNFLLSILEGLHSHLSFFIKLLQLLHIHLNYPGLVVAFPKYFKAVFSILQVILFEFYWKIENMIVSIRVGFLSILNLVLLFLYFGDHF